MADVNTPTRAELAKFLPNQRLIVAFEKLFEKSVQSVDVASFLEILAFLPIVEQPGVQHIDYFEFNEFPQLANLPRRIAWNSDEDCLNIYHKGGVAEQVGLETFIRSENATGSAIPNGTVVGFAGVNGEIKVSPYIADGSVPALYFLGVTTQSLDNGEIGKSTVFGKVRDIDTTGSSSGEVWAKGDILYASTTSAGKLTNVRPTAPNEVISVAVVLVVSSTEGQIFVRPQLPIGLDYAEYSSLADQTLIAANTAYPITFNNIEVEHGINLVSNSQITVSQSGLYSLSGSLQITSSNSSVVTAYAWIRKNGVDVPNTRKDFTIKANGDTKVLSATFQINLLANDYIELMWAGTSTNMILDYNAATGFAPASPSAIINIAQIQL